MREYDYRQKWTKLLTPEIVSMPGIALKASQTDRNQRCNLCCISQNGATALHCSYGEKYP